MFYGTWDTLSFSFHIRLLINFTFTLFFAFTLFFTSFTTIEYFHFKVLIVLSLEVNSITFCIYRNLLWSFHFLLLFFERNLINLLLFLQLLLYQMLLTFSLTSVTFLIYVSILFIDLLESLLCQVY